MRSIRLLNVIEKFPFTRQLPAGFEEKYDCRFYSGWPVTTESDGRHEDICDYLVCYDELTGGLITSIPCERRLLLIGEPPCITRYPAEYLNQFGIVVCPYDLPRYQGLQIRQHPALWWYYGINPKNYDAGKIWTWDEIAAMPTPEKKGEVAAICSNKRYCRRHVNRKTFVSRLAENLGDLITVFGPGFMPLPDKKDGIDPYKYHIVIENNDEPLFWTEKLADAYLGYAFPFYVGGKDVETDFPDGSMIRLDINNVDKSLAIIKKALAERVWEERLPLVKEARERILFRYNTFSHIRELVDSMPTPDVVPALENPVKLLSFVEARAPYHFREHLNHMAIKHLPLTKPLFPL